MCFSFKPIISVSFLSSLTFNFSEKNLCQASN
jgi:hypothetical protein